MSSGRWDELAAALRRRHRHGESNAQDIFLSISRTAVPADKGVYLPGEQRKFRMIWQVRHMPLSSQQDQA
jgi:hypothetical protein